MLNRMTMVLLLVCGVCMPLFAIPKVIFDSDMNGDVDDVGALALLHALAARNEVQILAVGASHPGSAVCECMDAINTWYGRPDIRVTAVRGTGNDGQYAGKIAAQFPHDITRDATPEPAALYRQILAAEPDSSVTLVTVGYLPNVAALLRSEADEYSDLNGMDLVRQKVKVWMCMGGVFPSGSEHNLTAFFADEAAYAVNNWPTRVVFTGWEVGKEVITGQYVQEHIKNSPVKLAYQYYFCSWAFDGNPYIAYDHGHYSWDQTAVLMAVRGISPYWDLVEVGYNHVNSDGTNEWRTDADKPHAYVVPAMPEAQVAAEIDGLMNQPPEGAYFSLSGTAGWIPFTLEFDGSYSNPGFGDTVAQYAWDFGDGSTATGATASHAYQTAGRYGVSLTVTDDRNDTYMQTDSIIVSDPVFAAHPVFGDARHYERINPDLWSTREHQGDLRYYVNNTARSSENTWDGFSFLADSVYETFHFTASVCIGEDLAEVRNADYKLVFNYQDDDNHAYLHMRPGLSRLYVYQNGSRLVTERLAGDGVPDQAYHTLSVSREADVLLVMLDDQVLFSGSEDAFTAPGKLAFGSDRSAVYFDDILVSRQITAVSSAEHKPNAFALQQNYPNPFNPQTTMRYTLDAASGVTLNVYDIRGRKMRTLVDQMQPSGAHQVVWDARDDQGNPVSSGVYLAELRVGDRVRVIKMNLLR